jgi:WD40 repeat protein
LQTLEGHTGAVWAVAFSRDGKLVASGSHNQTVKLWDPATGALQQTLEGHTGAVRAVAFSRTLQQTLEVDAVIRELSFSEDGSYLETDRGQLNIQSLYTGNSSLEICNVGYIVKDKWVARETTNIIWLPSDYQPTISAVRDGILVLGHGSGRVTFMELMW